MGILVIILKDCRMGRSDKGFSLVYAIINQH